VFFVSINQDSVHPFPKTVMNKWFSNRSNKTILSFHGVILEVFSKQSIRSKLTRWGILGDPSLIINIWLSKYFIGRILRKSAHSVNFLGFFCRYLTQFSLRFHIFRRIVWEYILPISFEQIASYTMVQNHGFSVKNFFG
jgi:hypothetical protein